MSRNNDVILYVTCILMDVSTRSLGAYITEVRVGTPNVFFLLPFVNMPTLKHSEMQLVELGINGRL